MGKWSWNNSYLERKPKKMSTPQPVLKPIQIDQEVKTMEENRSDTQWKNKQKGKYVVQVRQCLSKQNSKDRNYKDWSIYTNFNNWKPQQTNIEEHHAWQSIG